jgi:drug/metabolite transporter (DMT)-like permease
MRKALPYILLFLTALFWSGNFVLSRGIREVFPPVSLAFWRWAGAFVILLPFAAGPLWRQRKLVARHLGLLSVLAVLSVTTFNTFIYISMQTNPVANTVLINAMTPVFIYLLAWVAFREPAGVRRTAGVLVSFSGMLWIICRGAPGALVRLSFSAGDLWTLAASVSWALYSVLLRRRPQGLHPLAFMQALVGIGLLALLPAYAWELAGGARVAWSPATAASVVYVALFPSVLAYIFWNRAVAQVGATISGMFMYLMPVMSILMAYVFMGETLRPYHLAGFALIFAGIFLTSIRWARSPCPAGSAPRSSGAAGRVPRP